MTARLLKDAADWEAHRLAVARTNAVHPDCVGGTPEDYPCKAMTAVVETITGKRFLTAFFYLQDARDVMEMTLEATMRANMTDPAQSSHVEVLTRKMARFEAQQVKFNAQIAALSTAHTYLLRETGICTDEKFEQLYNEALGLVDEVATDQRATVLQKLQDQERLSERKAIERLFPPGE